jgi:hypothetical protein
VSTRPLLVCGPCLRYVDRSSAVVWVEVAEAMEVEVVCTPEDAGMMAPLTSRSFTVQIEDGHYAWLAIDWLVADTWYRYQVIGHRADGSTVPLWPDARASGVALPSVFRTMPTWSLDGFRMAFGSCRKGFDPADLKAPATGPDALEGLANTLLAHLDDRDGRQANWPHLLHLMGDQIYADDFSARLVREFDHELAMTYTEFAAVYREAWTSRPNVRWLLSCIPTFTIFDDHEVDDDWNITDDWVKSRRSRLGIHQMADGLLAYWVYQGAGNVPPQRWRLDERMRPLNPLMRPLIGDVTDRMRRMFQGYVTGRRDADWSYAVDVAGTRLAVADTRMHRKLTGHRLMIDNEAWDRYRDLAAQHPYRRVILITSGPFLLPQPLHDLQSWVADKLENDPSIFERAGTGLMGGIAGGIGGAIVGGGIGLLAGGPAGLIAGAGIGAAIGFGAGFVAGFFLEEIIEHILGGKIGDLDIELWPVFPTSFDRMLTLLEDLTDGRGTGRKPFVAMLGGDVHFSYAMHAQLQRTRTRREIWNLTVSPTGNLLDEGRDDVKDLKALIGGDYSVRTELQLMKATGVYYRPGFVDEQMRRLSWHPTRADGSAAEASRSEEWSHFGNFVGWLELDGVNATYRYDRALDASAGVQLEPCASSTMLAV